VCGAGGRQVEGEVQAAVRDKVLADLVVHGGGEDVLVVRAEAAHDVALAALRCVQRVQRRHAQVPHLEHTHEEHPVSHSEKPPAVCSRTGATKQIQMGASHNSLCFSGSTPRTVQRNVKTRCGLPGSTVRVHGDEGHEQGGYLDVLVEGGGHEQ
jgi:hypothetical protein